MDFRLLAAFTCAKINAHVEIGSGSDADSGELSEFIRMIFLSFLGKKRLIKHISESVD